MHELPHGSEWGGGVHRRRVRPHVQKRFPRLRWQVRRQHGDRQLRSDVVRRVSGADRRWHRHLRRLGLCSGLSRRQQAVQRSVHQHRARLRRGLSDRNAQLHGHLPVGHQHQLLRSRLCFLSGTLVERCRRLCGGNMRDHLQRGIQELPGDQYVRAVDRLLHRRRLHDAPAEHHLGLRQRKHVQLSVRDRIQDVRDCVYSNGKLLHKRGLRGGWPGYRAGVQRDERVQLPVRTRIQDVRDGLYPGSELLHERGLHGGWPGYHTDVQHDERVQLPVRDGIQDVRDGMPLGLDVLSQRVRIHHGGRRRLRRSRLRHHLQHRELHLLEQSQDLPRPARQFRLGDRRRVHPRPR
jgi:hypothetical protein